MTLKPFKERDKAAPIRTGDWGYNILFRAHLASNWPGIRPSMLLVQRRQARLRPPGGRARHTSACGSLNTPCGTGLAWPGWAWGAFADAEQLMLPQQALIPRHRVCPTEKTGQRQKVLEPLPAKGLLGCFPRWAGEDGGALLSC
jgi:hypothetical protein